MKRNITSHPQLPIIYIMPHKIGLSVGSIFSCIDTESHYLLIMFICSCRAVTDRQIRASIESGNDHLQAIMEDTGAGECCGSCKEDILQMILDSLPPRVGQKEAIRNCIDQRPSI